MAGYVYYNCRRREPVHCTNQDAWIAHGTFMRAPLHDGIKSKMQAFKIGFEELFLLDVLGLCLQWWNGHAFAWCTGAMDSSETGSLCERQSWEHCSVPASAVVLGGCRWTREPAQKAICPDCERWASFKSCSTACLSSIFARICPMDSTPGRNFLNVAHNGQPGILLPQVQPSLQAMCSCTCDSAQIWASESPERAYCPSLLLPQRAPWHKYMDLAGQREWCLLNSQFLRHCLSRCVNSRGAPRRPSLAMGCHDSERFRLWSFLSSVLMPALQLHVSCFLGAAFQIYSCLNACQHFMACDHWNTSQNV